MKNINFRHETREKSWEKFNLSSPDDFEKMKIYKIYFIHNNFDEVIRKIKRRKSIKKVRNVASPKKICNISENLSSCG